MTIEIDPPVFGPVRLGMFETEARDSLSTLGTVKDKRTPRAFYAINDDTGLMIHVQLGDADEVVWTSSSPLPHGNIRHLFRGIDLFRPYRDVLRELLGVGLALLADKPRMSFAIERVGLTMERHDTTDTTFTVIGLAAPEVFPLLTDGKQPFTLGRGQRHDS